MSSMEETADEQLGKLHAAQAQLGSTKALLKEAEDKRAEQATKTKAEVHLMSHQISAETTKVQTPFKKGNVYQQPL